MTPLTVIETPAGRMIVFVADDGRIVLRPQRP